MTTSPLRCDSGHGGLLPSIRISLQKLSAQQAELVDDKEQILVDRQRIASSAFTVRKQRDRTKDAEVRLMDIFRKLYMDRGSTVPENLAITYSAVEKMRDDLVEVEDKHAQLTQELELSEWALIEKEEHLYQRDIQQLLSRQDLDLPENVLQAVVHRNNVERSSMSPSPELQYQVALVEHRRAVRRFHDLIRHHLYEVDANSMLPMEDANSLNDRYVEVGVEWEASELLDHMIECEIKVLHSKAKLDPRRGLGLLGVQVRSEPYDTRSKPRHDWIYQPKTQSDGSLQRPKNTRTSDSSIDEWILDCLKENIDHKLHFMAILQKRMGHSGQPCLKYDHWEEHIVRDWSFDSSDAGVLQSTTLSIRSSTTSLGSQGARDYSHHQEFAPTSPEDLHCEPASASQLQWALHIPYFRIDSPSSIDSGAMVNTQILDDFEIPEKSLLLTSSSSYRGFHNETGSRWSDPPGIHSLAAHHHTSILSTYTWSDTASSLFNAEPSTRGQFWQPVLSTDHENHMHSATSNIPSIQALSGQ